MRKFATIITVLVVSILIIISSCKKDDPEPEAKKKYAWATGDNGHYIVSTDGGGSWKNDSIPIGGVNGADINHMVMLDEQSWGLLATWAMCGSQPMEETTGLNKIFRLM